MYSVVLDIDGNGWSDRYVRMAHFNTPILKQVRWSMYTRSPVHPTLRPSPWCAVHACCGLSLLMLILGAAHGPAVSMITNLFSNGNR